MRMGEPHTHMRELTESASASSLILLLQSFSGVLNVRHLPGIVVLIQYAASAWDERHEHGRTTYAYEGVRIVL